MRISRIHLPIQSSEVTQTLVISGDKAHYIRSVLRLKKGQSIVFFTIDGYEFQAQISEVLRHEILLNEIVPSTNPTKTSLVNTTIVQAISAGDRMDYTVQKSAEMGANQLIPVFSEFCSQKIPTNKYEKKQAHWQAVANSACEQSGRCDLLTIQPISNLSTVLSTAQSQGIYLEPTAKSKIKDIPDNLKQELSIYIGPEGGFSENEIDLFKAAGLFGVHLGQRILRTETAAPVILSAVHTLFGDFA